MNVQRETEREHENSIYGGGDCCLYTAANYFNYLILLKPYSKMELRLVFLFLNATLCLSFVSQIRETRGWEWPTSSSGPILAFYRGETGAQTWVD